MSSNVLSYNITGLTSGVTYYVRVSASNGKGYGSWIAPTPTGLAPKALPGAPTSLALRHWNNSALEVEAEVYAAGNGDSVSSYLLQLDTSASFSSANLKTHTLTPDYTVQHVTTAANFGPIGGTFTLAVGDFAGDFTVQLGGALFDIGQGGSTLVRAFSSVSSPAFTSVIARRDLIKVGDKAFRVHASSASFNSNNIPLALATDATVTATWTGAGLSAQPVFMLDTSLGAATVAPGDASLTTAWSSVPLANDMTGKVSPGDLIRVGDPWTGDTFRVLVGGTFTSLLLPLATPEDPRVPATYNNTALELYPVYKLQTTAPLSYTATTWDVKKALEALSLVAVVDVDRGVAGNGFQWTVSFRRFAMINNGPVAPLRMDANAVLLTAVNNPAGQLPTVTVVGAVRVVVGGLLGGLPYMARYTAISGQGAGAFTASVPVALAPADDVPRAVQEPVVQVAGNSEALVQWEPPAHDSGLPVVRYLVEWDTSLAFSTSAGMPLGSVLVDYGSAFAPVVDEVTVTCAAGGFNNLGGSFAIVVTGQSTGRLPYNIQAVDLKGALEALSTVDTVSVTRNIVNYG